MRHRNSSNNLGRKTAHRNAMMANMASSLIKHKRIKTTTAKAKALRSYIEPLLTRSKEDTTHSRRIVFGYLQDKDAVTELFREVAGKIGERPGGYTRILKIGARTGDAAEMAIIELVDFNENLLGTGKEAKTASRRRRRTTKKKADETPGTPAEKTIAVAEAEPVAETAEEETSKPEVQDTEGGNDSKEA